MSATSRPLNQTTPDEEGLALFFEIRTQNREDEDQLFRLAKELEPQLSTQISFMVPRLLPPFRFQRIEIHRGSVEIWVLLLGSYTLMSQYADFVNSVELVKRQIEELLQSLLTNRLPAGGSIRGGWYPVPPTKSRRLTPSRFRSEPKELVMLLMTSYLITSHAVMLVVLLRIAAKVFLQANNANP